VGTLKSVNADKNGANVMPTKLALNPEILLKKRVSADTCVGTNDHFSSKNVFLCPICRRYIKAVFVGVKPFRSVLSWNG